MAKTPSFIELNGEFITKPSDIANYFNNYFLSKVNTLRNQMLPVSGGLSKAIIKNHIMCGKDCVFDFKAISADFMVKILHTIKCDKPCGFDNIDGRLLQLSAKSIAKPVGHIFIFILFYFHIYVLRNVLILICGKLQRLLLCQKTVGSHLQVQTVGLSAFDLS